MTQEPTRANVAGCGTCGAQMNLLDPHGPPPRPDCIYELGAGADTCMTRALRTVAANAPAVTV